ncbi:hypothetical protein EO96_14400 [Methanosarcina sp. 2.H.T.1A.8]|nr:hypothetical protein EO96_14400 [Methanosarcina sp. 2.H.T.1A.8]
MFPKEWLRQTTKETGLIVRERKIDPVIIFWVLTFSLDSLLKKLFLSINSKKILILAHKL